MQKSNKLWGIVVASLMLALCLFACVRIHITPSGYGECISISFFENYIPENVDKIVIEAQGQEVVITDPALIRELVSETTIATHANIGHGEQRQIHVYSGDQLLRSMAWGICCDTVTVYEADSTHWLLAPEPPATGNRGCVYLSRELAAQLNALLKENQT